jgi:hypothetical protein
VPAGKPLNRLDVEFETEGSACLDLTHVLQTSNLPWELVELSPGLFSGLGTLNQPYTGPGVYNTPCNILGTYKIRSQLGAPCSVQSGKYLWPDLVATDPEPVFRQMVKNEVFESGLNMHQITRVVVAQIHEDQTGRGVFSDVFRIPAEWQDSVRPAIDYLKKHSELFEAKGSDRTRSESQGLLSSSNPFLVQAAALTRQEAGIFSTDDLQVVLATENPKLVAGVLAVIVSHGWLQLDSNTDWLSSRVPIASSEDELEGIALGLLDAGQIVGHDTQCEPPDGLAPYSTKDRVRDHMLMALVRARLTQLTPQGPSNDPHWVVIDNCCNFFME